MERWAASDPFGWKSALITRWSRAVMRPFSTHPDDPAVIMALGDELGPEWLAQYSIPAPAAEPKKSAKKSVAARTTVAVHYGRVVKVPAKPRARAKPKRESFEAMPGFGYWVNPNDGSTEYRPAAPFRPAPNSGGDTGHSPVGDGVHVRMHPSGDVVTFEEARRRLAQ